MNNFILSQQFNTHPKHVTITEHRAPTEDSVRLLQEIKQQVMSEFIGSFEYNSNLVSGVFHIFRDHMIGNTTVKFVFSLNNERHIVDVEFNILELSATKDTDVILSKINKTVSEYITHLFLVTATPHDQNSQAELLTLLRS